MSYESQRIEIVTDTPSRLIRDVGHKGKMFRVAREGYDTDDRLA